MIDVYSMSPAEVKAEAKRRAERKAQGLPLTESSVTKGNPDDLAKVTRTDTECRIILKGPPRTKKNHTVAHGVQGPAYTKYLADVKSQLRDFKPPLPDKPYNLNAQFFVDGNGSIADLVGLMQGLADALQDAKVVSNDKWFLGWDGTRKHDDDRHNPRTELVITELTRE